MTLLTRAALRACDAADGLADGIIANPAACRFDPHSLVCKSGQTDECLSSAQADAVETIYHGVTDPTSGAQIVPGRYGTMGTEADPVQWPLWITGPTPLGLPIASSHFKYVVYANPTLDIMHLDPVRALNDSRLRVDAVLSALDANLDQHACSSRTRTLGAGASSRTN